VITTHARAKHARLQLVGNHHRAVDWLLPSTKRRPSPLMLGSLGRVAPAGRAKPCIGIVRQLGGGKHGESAGAMREKHSRFGPIVDWQQEPNSAPVFRKAKRRTTRASRVLDRALARSGGGAGGSRRFLSRGSHWRRDCVALRSRRLSILGSAEVNRVPKRVPNSVRRRPHGHTSPRPRAPDLAAAPHLRAPDPWAIERPTQTNWLRSA
jgi:hypothetical protein